MPHPLFCVYFQYLSMFFLTPELELFSLPPPEGSVASLKAWRDKARYILGQLPASERPAKQLMSKWFLEKLMKVPSLRRHTDKVRDSPEGSVERGFEWLWSHLDRAILQTSRNRTYNPSNKH